MVRAGTTKSRAPSGVEAISIGVSISTKSWASIAARIARLTTARVRRLRCMSSRRMSRYRCRSRTVSSTSAARSSRGNGGGSATVRISTWQSPTSISPVDRLGFTVPSGRGRTVPVTRTTYSLRRSAAPSTTHCTTPEWSRRSMKARCSPCSRRRATHPQRATSWPTWSSPRSPQRWVRMEVESSITWLVLVRGWHSGMAGPLAGAPSGRRPGRHGRRGVARRRRPVGAG